MEAHRRFSFGWIEIAVSRADFWQRTNAAFGFGISTLAINANGHFFAGTYGGGIFRSVDKGNNWTPINTGLTFPHIICLAINAAGDLFAGAVDGIFRSTNNGDSWIPIKAGLDNLSVNTIVIDSSGYILVGTTWSSYGSGVFRSIDNGDSWQRITMPDSYVYSLAISPNRHVFAATNCCRNVGLQTGGIFRSLDKGESWKRVYENGDRVGGLAINRRGHLFAIGSIEGVVLSTDDGESWKSANSGLENAITLTLALNSREHIFAGTWWSGIFRSTDQGESWAAINSGLTSSAIWSFAVDAQDYVYAGDDSGRVFRSAEPTSVKEFGDRAPTHFALGQNYLNPFNPSSTFSFSLPRPSFVSLEIYNLLGEEVATLVHERRAAGEHPVQWQANGLPSGVYVYRLRAGEFVQSKKLLLMR